MSMSAVLISSDAFSLKDIEAITRGHFGNFWLGEREFVLEREEAQVNIWEPSFDFDSYEPEELEEERALLKAEPVCECSLRPLPSRVEAPWDLMREFVVLMMERYNCILYTDRHDRFYTRDTLPERFCS